MQVGINYPWLCYDWDFGEPPLKPDGKRWDTRAQWRGRLAQDLKTFNDIGIFAVRWFILGSGLLYGTSTEAPRPSTHGWTIPTVPDLPQAIVDDFRSTLPYFRAANMKMLPVFVDFRMFLSPTPKEMKGLSSGYVKGGRQELITNKTNRAQFLQKALQPLLKATAGFADVIYAWDLINEPEGSVRNQSFLSRLFSRRKTDVDQTSMLSFLREGIAMINTTKLRSSVGFANRETVDKWHSIDLKVSLHQFHYYVRQDRPNSIPRHTFSQEYPLIVGEFASAAHNSWPELHGSEGRDPSSIVLRRLRLLAEKGYPAAFIWSAEEKPAPEDPPTVAWNPSTRDQIRKFTTGN